MMMHSSVQTLQLYLLQRCLVHAVPAQQAVPAAASSAWAGLVQLLRRQQQQQGVGTMVVEAAAAAQQVAVHAVPHQHQQAGLVIFHPQSR
jgi:hypothetical protein